MSTIINTILSTLVGFAFGYIIKLLNERRNEKEALKCLLRSEITNIYYKSVERGFIYRYEKENLSYLNSAYVNLNGNSYIKDAVKELDEFPVQN